MELVRPVAIKPSTRISAVTPNPRSVSQFNRVNRQISRSPQPFVTHNFSMSSTIGDYPHNINISNHDSLNNIIKGIHLLNISQLREILSDYSLPNGGNKTALINRIVMFLETFGQNQTDIIQQFSIKLKKLLLSVDNNDSNGNKFTDTSSLNVVPSMIIPTNVLNLFSSSPTCLYEDAKYDNILDPFVITSSLSQIYSFNIPHMHSNIIPILQFAPLDPNHIINQISVQINDTFLGVSRLICWLDLKDFIGKSCNLEIVSINPKIPVVAAVRCLKSLTVQEIMQIVLTREPVPVIKDHKVKGICPLTRKLIIKPTRGIQCHHSQCFDLSGFICYSLRKKQWQCPVCKKVLMPEDLRIDTHFFANASLTDN